jgi:hypothetical protein
MKAGKTNKTKIFQAKIKNRWKDVTIIRRNKTTIRVFTGKEEVTVKNDEVRKKPPVKKTVKKKVTKSTKTITKPRKSTPKVDTPVVKTPKPGTKKNPWIPLADLRSHNLISNLDYETKVKFESIILSLIKDM